MCSIYSHSRFPKFPETRKLVKTGENQKLNCHIADVPASSQEVTHHPFSFLTSHIPVDEFNLTKVKWLLALEPYWLSQHLCIYLMIQWCQQWLVFGRVLEPLVEMFHEVVPGEDECQSEHQNKLRCYLVFFFLCDLFAFYRRWHSCIPLHWFLRSHQCTWGWTCNTVYKSFLVDDWNPHWIIQKCKCHGPDLCCHHLANLSRSQYQ